MWYAMSDFISYSSLQQKIADSYLKYILQVHHMSLLQGNVDKEC